MIKIKMSSLLLLAITVLFLGACKDPHIKKHDKKPHTKSSDRYYYEDIYFGKYLPKEYKKGIVDGCTTAKGKYQKSHTLFKTNKYYEDAWFVGRNKCKDLLEVKEVKK
jgi:hypothetical protein